jgi:hypothetical protein
MSPESPEAVFHHILSHTAHTPDPAKGDSYYSENHRRQIQAVFGGRLAEDFNYSDLFTVEMIAQRMQKKAESIEIPPAYVVNDDAYMYMGGGLVALIREADARWRLRISLFMCAGCFGAHNYPGGGCWGVLCECCGGTGWESGDLEFCTHHELPIDNALLISTSSPRAAFLHLYEAQIPVLHPLQSMPEMDISPALARGDTAKIELRTQIDLSLRYLALMRLLPTQQWHLSAFLPLCAVCGGTGEDLQSYLPCSGCGGLKWGQAGDLRYTRHDPSSNYWQRQD